MYGSNLPERPYVNISSIAVAKAIKSKTWRKLAELSNWILCQQEQYIPWHVTVIPSSGTVLGLNYKFTPNGRGVKRGWFWGYDGYRAEILTAYETTPQERAIPTDVSSSIRSNISSGSYFISALDHKRTYLSSDAIDTPADPLTCDAATPISATAYSSVGGLLPPLAQSNRRHYLGQAVPANKVDAWQFTTANESLIKLGVILARKVYVGDTTGPVTWYFYVETVDDKAYISIENVKTGSIGVFEAPQDAGGWHWVDTDTMLNLGDVLTWECEDLTTTSGMPSGLWQEFNINIQASSGTVYCASVCAEETP